MESSVNPHVQPVGGSGYVFLTTAFGKYRAQVPPETQRVTIIREANTNGVWAFPVEDFSEKRLTFVQAGAILAFEFNS